MGWGGGRGHQEPSPCINTSFKVLIATCMARAGQHYILPLTAILKGIGVSSKAIVINKETLGSFQNYKKVGFVVISNLQQRE